MKRQKILSLCGMILLLLCLSLFAGAQAPTPIPLTGPTTVCEGTKHSYFHPTTPTVYYSWQINTKGYISSVTGNNALVFWGAQGTGVLTVYGIDTLGDTVELGITNVTILAKPEPVITTDTRVACQPLVPPPPSDMIPPPPPVFVDTGCLKVCENSTVTYTANGDPSSSYTWTVSGGSASPSGNTCTVIWGAKGPGKVTVTETTINGCEGTKSICIDIIESPIADFFAFPDSNSTTIHICDSSEVIFIDRSTATAASPIVAWHWDFGDGNFSNAQGGRLMPLSHVYRGPGNYTAILTVTNACGCKSSYSIEIIVDGQKALRIDCPAVVCEGDFADYSVNTACGNPANWSVIGGTIHFPTGNTVTVEWNMPDASGFGYVFYDGNGCPGVCPSVFVAKVPIVMNSGVIQGPDTICPDKEYIFRLPQWPTTKFTWHETTGNANMIPSDQPNELVITVDDGNAGNTITLECNYTNTILGCGGFATKDVYVQTRPKLSGPDIVCLNTYGTYTLTGPNASSANWTLTYPDLSTSTGSGSSFSPFFDQVGPYILSIEGDFCPPPTKEITVNLPPPPPDTIIGPDTICKGAPVKFEAGNELPGHIFNWWVENGDANAASGNNSFIKLDINSVGPFVVHLWRESTMSPHCHSDTITKTIDTPVVIFNVGGPDVVCPSSYHDYAVNYHDGETYRWFIDDQLMGSVMSGQSTDAVRVLWNSTPGTAKLICEIRKCFGNYYYDTLEVAIGIIPTVAITAPSSACNEESVAFSVTGSGSGVTWDMGDGNIINSGSSINHTYKLGNSTAITIKVTATVHDPNGCPGEVTTTKNITINPGPVSYIASTGPGIYYCDSNVIETLSVVPFNSSPTIVSYQWYRNGVATSTSSTYNVPGFGSYTVKLTGSNGCVYTTEAYNITYYCQDTCSLSISPVVSIDNITLTDCGLVNVTSSHSSTGFISYSWNVSPNGVFTHSDIDDADIQFTVAGSYYVGYSGYYTDGTDTCEFDDRKPFNIPYISGIGITQLCTGASGTRDVLLSFKGTQIAPITNYTFRVDGSVVYSGSSSTYTANVTSGTNHTFDLIIWDGVNPRCTATKVEFIRPLPLADFTFLRDTTCSVQAPVDFMNISSPGGFSSKWTFADGSGNTQHSPERVYNSGGLYNVVLTITDVFGCSDDTTIEVPVINMRLVGSISPTPPSPCKGQPVFLTYTPLLPSFPDYPEWYEWMNDDINFASGIFNPMTVFESGYYWVRGTDHYGCYVETEADTVNVVEVPPAFVSGDTNQCKDASFILSGYAGSDPDIQYSWLLNGSVLFGENSALLQQTHSIPGFYNYRVIITIPNPGGGTCSDTSDPLRVRVRALPASPGINYNIVDCNDYTVELQASPALTYGTYNWSTGQSGTPVYVQTGGNFQLTYTDTFGCESDSAIAVPKDPRVYLWIFPTGCFSVCLPDMITVTGPIIPFTYWEYLYNGGPGFAGTGIPVDYSFNTAGIYNLFLDNGWCQVTSGNMYLDNSCEGKPGRPENVMALQHGDVTMELVPNPANDKVTVSYQFSEASQSRWIEVYDVTGRQVSKHEATAIVGKWELNLDRYTSGMYNVMMREDGNVLLYGKLSIVK